MWTPTDEVKQWLREKYSYDPLTGVIVDGVTREQCGWIDRGYRKLRLSNAALGIRRYTQAQCLAMFLVTNEWPTCDVDHKNHDTLDNRIDNLRLATRTQNLQNSIKCRHRAGRTPSSKHKGVYFHKRSGKWLARINLDKRQVHLGLFTLEHEAAEAYNVTARAHFGEFAHVSELGAPSIV